VAYLLIDSLRCSILLNLLFHMHMHKEMSGSADHDQETSSNADASFCCADCGQELNRFKN